MKTSGSTGCCSRCTTPASTSPARSLTMRENTSARSFSRQWYLATSVSPKHQALENRSSCTTPRQSAPRHTCRSRASSWNEQPREKPMAAERQTPPRRLGRGLEALLGNASGLASSDEGALKSIPVSQIVRNPFQPRKEFKADELAELQESLSASGLLQPITVRRSAGKDGCALIAGESLLRAAIDQRSH